MMTRGKQPYKGARFQTGPLPIFVAVVGDHQPDSYWLVIDWDSRSEGFLGRRLFARPPVGVFGTLLDSNFSIEVGEVKRELVQ